MANAKAVNVTQNEDIDADRRVFVDELCFAQIDRVANL